MWPRIQPQGYGDGLTPCLLLLTSNCSRPSTQEKSRTLECRCYAGCDLSLSLFLDVNSVSN